MGPSLDSDQRAQGQSSIGILPVRRRDGRAGDGLEVLCFIARRPLLDELGGQAGSPCYLARGPLSDAPGESLEAYATLGAAPFELADRL